jgi:6-phosphofructokinase 1
LTPQSVAEIHHDGGTMLGASRGNQDPGLMVDRLVELGVGVLFVIGGDGSLRGAMALVEEIARRDLHIGVVGIPKTIDNDVHFIDRSFGFESAFAAAVDVIRSAHVEATGARNGIGLVKLMGRHSGFIACNAALASADVDAVLIPEVSVDLEGRSGVFPYLARRLSETSSTSKPRSRSSARSDTSRSLRTSRRTDTRIVLGTRRVSPARMTRKARSVTSSAASSSRA